MIGNTQKHSEPLRTTQFRSETVGEGKVLHDFTNDHVHDCQAPKINPSQACEQYQPEWQKYIQSHSCENFSGVRCILRRPGETLPWQPNSNIQGNNIQGNLQPHDQDVPEHQKKNYFSPNGFYCVETICAPCGTVIAWTKFVKSESPTNILNFLANIYPTEDSRPDYICIDKACLVLRTCISNGSWEEWKKTSRFVVDSYHYRNHSDNDTLCLHGVILHLQMVQHQT